MPQPETYRRFNPRLAYLGRLLDFVQPGLNILINRRDGTGLTETPLSSFNPRRILVIESHLIGDTVLLAPLLKSLRTRFPAASLDVLGNPWAQDILGPLDLADHFELQRIPWSLYDYSIRNLRSLLKKVLELRSRQYDLSIDPRGDARNAVLLWLIGATRRLGFGFTGGVKFLTDVADSPRSDAHLLDAKFSVLVPLGIHGMAEPPSLICTDEAKLAIRPFLSELRARGPMPLLGFHPGASQVQRKLDIGQNIRILQGLVALGGIPVLIGTISERKELESIATQACIQHVPIFTGTLPQFMALATHLTVMVGMDSGPTHLSSALGTPTVVLTEAHKVGITTPIGSHVRSVAPAPGKSLQDLEVAPVMEALEALLNIV